MYTSSQTTKFFRTILCILLAISVTFCVSGIGAAPAEAKPSTNKSSSTVKKTNKKSAKTSSAKKTAKSKASSSSKKSTSKKAQKKATKKKTTAKKSSSKKKATAKKSSSKKAAKKSSKKKTTKKKGTSKKTSNKKASSKKTSTKKKTLNKKMHSSKPSKSSKKSSKTTYRVLTTAEVQKHVGSKVGNRSWGRQFHHMCLAFVATTWLKATKTNYYSTCCARKYGKKHRVSSSMHNIPIGADVFFTGSYSWCGACGRNAGHVGIYVGDGYMVHSIGGHIKKERVLDVANIGNLHYYGWGWHEGVKIVPNKGNDPYGSVDEITATAGKTIKGAHTKSKSKSNKSKARRISRTKGTILVKGWAVDKSSSNKPLKINVWVGAPSAGGEFHTLKTNIYDQGLNAQEGISGNHRFSGTISTKKHGLQTIYVYAKNIGSGNDVLLVKKKVRL